MKDIRELIKDLRQANVRLSLRDSDIEINTLGGTVSEAVLEEVRQHKARIVAYLKKSLNTVGFSRIEPVNVRDGYPLSSSQRRLWVLSQVEAGGAAYSIPGIYVFEGNVNPAGIAHAFRAVIERHEILRTVFHEDVRGEVRQFVRSPGEVNFAMDTADLRGDAWAEAQAQALVQAAVTRPFDLTTGPLLRAGLHQLADDKWVFVYVMHHIVGDGWSVGVLIKELLLLYNAYVAGEANPLSPLRIQYKDYAVWQQELLAGAALNNHRDYWLAQFEGEQPVLELPTDYRRPAVPTYEGGLVNRYIGSVLTRALRSLSQEQGGTLFMGLLAAVNALLCRYTRSTDIVIGSPIAGRDHVDLTDQVGFYVNMLALRTRFRSEDSFQELLANIKRITLGAYTHQGYPFDALVEALPLKREMGRSPLFDVSVALQTEEVISTQGAYAPGNLRVSPYRAEESQPSKFDLSFAFVERGDEIQLSVGYNRALFTRPTIERIATHFEQLLAVAVATPALPIEQLDYLSAGEKHQLLSAFNSNASGEAASTVLERWEVQVNKTPDQPALAYRNNSLTYRQVNESANQLSNYLRRVHGVGAGSRVGVKLERSHWMVTTLLAVFKSGATYVPIDPSYPQDRIDYLTIDSKCKVVISEALLQHFNAQQEAYEKKDSGRPLALASIAYIIYTSGSTGAPKGVLVSHANLAHFCRHVASHYAGISPMVQPFLASSSFDISLFQLLMPLLCGGVTIVVDKDQFQDLSQLAAVLKETTVIDSVPGIFTLLTHHILDYNLAGDFLHIQRLFIGGDTIPDSLLQRLAQAFPSATITVTYGPTEGTIFCTHLDYLPGTLPADCKGSVIGRPISGTQLYLLDNQPGLTPVGVTGEICIGGDGLALGYWDRPDLTAEKFVPNPFAPDQRMYRTGDLGRWLADGNLEFMGRNDDQVKVRGFRIELGEITDRMRQHEAVEEALVTVAADQHQDQSLTGYFVRKKQVQVWPSISEYLGYNDLAYFAMNDDDLRAGSYKKAIMQQVKDKIVIDVGTGPEAILAQHCVEAGAKRVYAIEILDEMYQKAKSKIKSLGLEDKIILIHGDIMDISLPEKADYCVCALVGNLGSSDGCIPIMNRARQFLQDPACMIPHRSVTQIAAMSVPKDLVNYHFTEAGAYYLENIFGNVGHSFDLRIGLQNVAEHHLVSTTGIFEDLDLTTELPLNQERDIELVITADAEVNGFLLWLNLHTAPGIVNDIFKSQKSFLPIFFPVFEDPLPVRKDEVIRAKVWVETAEGDIYPDYGLRGELLRADGSTVPFVYVSRRLPGTYRQGAFHRQLFPEGPLPVTPSFSLQSLREYLQHKLPEYMVPAALIELDQLPLNAHGKIDRKALRLLAETAVGSSTGYVAPRNKIETHLIAIWQEVLGRGQIGIADNFFEAGGNSIKIIRLAKLVSAGLGRDINVALLFHYPTIKDLVDHLMQEPVLSEEEDVDRNALMSELDKFGTDDI